MHCLESIVHINDEIDRMSLPYAVNEQQIESLLSDLERTALYYSPLFWLTMARITETTLVCAGHYADNCEFSAAGDLLMNPRKIHVYIPGRKFPLVKKRHGRLSDQLNPFMGDAISKKEVRCEIVTPALLPCLHGWLEQSDFFSADYVDDVAVRMMRIADTIAFLTSYQTFSNEVLYQKLNAAGEKERQFVESHLCKFSTDTFQRLRRQIERLVVAQGQWEPILHIPEAPSMGETI